MTDVTSPCPASSAALGGLLRRWQRGWALSRRLGPAEEVAGALCVPVGLEGRRAEYFVAAPDGRGRVLEGAARRVAASPECDWLTVATEAPRTVAEALSREGLSVVTDEEFLMTVELREHPPPVVGAYELVTTTRGPLVEARVLTREGAVAAGGVMAVAGGGAVADRIATDPAHRRRGLGRAVMGALARGARGLGAREGVLIASWQGHRLYTALGWSTHATVVIGATARTVEVLASRGRV